MEAKVGIGFIGAGDMGQSHLRVLSTLENAVTVAIYEPNPERRRAATEVCGNQSVLLCSSRQELLDRKDIDAVFVTTPNNQHCEDVLAVAAAGKDCFCEKPLSANMGDCFKIVKAVEESGILFQLGLVYRYSKLFHRMAELIEHGVIGEPRMSWCHEFRVPFPVGRGREWRYLESASGGTLVEKNCHHFDLFNWMLRSEPVSVYASGNLDIVNANGPVFPGVPGEPHRYAGPSDVIDSSWVIVEYENGSRACLGLCMFAQDRDLPFGVLGSHGWIEALVKKQELRWRSYNEEQIFKEDFDDAIIAVGDDRYMGHPGGVRQVEDFIKSVQDRREPFCNAQLSIGSMIVSFAAEMSRKRHERVDITEVYGQLKESLPT